MYLFKCKQIFVVFLNNNLRALLYENFLTDSNSKIFYRLSHPVLKRFLASSTTCAFYFQQTGFDYGVVTVINVANESRITRNSSRS